MLHELSDKLSGNQPPVQQGLSLNIMITSLERLLFALAFSSEALPCPSKALMSCHLRGSFGMLSLTFGMDYGN
jgi:hypothetical protein